MKLRPLTQESRSEKVNLFWKINWKVCKQPEISRQRQIVDCIRKEHAEGNFPPGGIMPSYRKLGRYLNVNRCHVQRAYNELCEENAILYLKEGKTRMYIPDEPEQNDESDPEDLPIHLLDLNDFLSKDTYRQNTLTLGKSGSEVLREVFDNADKDKDRNVQQTGAESITYYDYIFGAGLRFLLSKGYIDGKNEVHMLPEHAALIKIIRSVTTSGDEVAIASYADYVVTSTILDLGRRPVYVGADKYGLLIENVKQLCEKQAIKAVLVRPHSDFPIPNRMTGSRFAELIQLSRQYKFWIILLDDTHVYRKGTMLDPSINTRRVIYLCHFPWLNPLYNVYMIAGPPKLINPLKLKPRRSFLNWVEVPQKSTVLNALTARLEKEIEKIRMMRDSACRTVKRIFENSIHAHAKLIIPESGVFATVIFKEPLDTSLINTIRGSPLYFVKENLTLDKKRPVTMVRISLLTTNWTTLKQIFSYIDWSKTAPFRSDQR